MNSNEDLACVPSASEIANRIRHIGEDLLRVAHDLTRALDARPGLIHELQEEGINMELVRRLEKLGRNQIHPDLAFSTTPGATKLLRANLSEQTIILKEGAELLDADEVTTRKIPIHEVTAAQARQLFYGQHIRTIAEQRTWIRHEKLKAGSATPTNDFRVYRDRVVTSRPGVWSRSLILQWLMEMN